MDGFIGRFFSGLRLGGGFLEHSSLCAQLSSRIMTLLEESRKAKIFLPALLPAKESPQKVIFSVQRLLKRPRLACWSARVRG